MRNDAQVDHTVATNLVGSIQLIRSALPHLSSQGGGRTNHIPTRRAQVAFPGTRCTTLRRLVSRVVESVAQEVAPFGTGSTIVEPGGARAEFCYGSPRSPSLCPSTTDAPAHSFLEMLDPASGLAPGDPATIAARIIDSVDVEPATLRAQDR